MNYRTKTIASSVRSAGLCVHKGRVFFLDLNSRRVCEISATGKVSEYCPQLLRISFASGIVADSHGNLYVGDSGYNRILKISPDKEVTVLLDVENPRALYWTGSLLYFATASQIFKLDPNTRNVEFVAGAPVRGTVDGEASVAKFEYPCGFCFLGEDLFVTDSYNFCVRKISGNVVTTVTSNTVLSHPFGILLSNYGEMLVVDSNHNCIRKLDPATGRLEVWLGDPNNAGRPLSDPRDMCKDETGIYVVNFGTTSILKIFWPTPWTVQRHKDFPRDKRAVVRALMMLRRKKGCQVARLPKEMVFLVLANLLEV